MTATVTCDNEACSNNTPQDRIHDLDWIKVGFEVSPLKDACSIDCAKVILDEMQQTLWDFEQQEEVETLDA